MRAVLPNLQIAQPLISSSWRRCTDRDISDTSRVPLLFLLSCPRRVFRSLLYLRDLGPQHPALLISSRSATILPLPHNVGQDFGPRPFLWLVGHLDDARRGRRLAHRSLTSGQKNHRQQLSGHRQRRSSAAPIRLPLLEDIGQSQLCA